MATDMLKEIENDIRDERTARLWNSFGKFMVYASIVIVLVTIGTVMWQNHKESYAMQQTSQLIKGLDRMSVEDYKGAIEAFDVLAADGDSAYYGLAMFRKAQAQALLGDKDGATKTYQALAAHDNGKHIFASLGSILASHQTGKVIEPVKGGAFYYLQCEWKGWQLMQQDKKDEAAKVFSALYADAETPTSIRVRAAAALEQIAPEKLAASTSVTSHE